MKGKPVIGIIGLGIMGHAMAINSHKAGFPVVAYNRSKQKGEDLLELGITLADTPRIIGEKADIIVIMVTDPKAVQDVLLGPKGLFEGPIKNKILIQASTIDYKSTIRFANEAKGCGMKFIDCPVTGSKKQVEEAQLILLAGGDPDLIEEVSPFLSAIGKAVVYAGEIGKGTTLKLCMNMIVAQMTTALCESVALAKVGDLDPAKIFEVLENSPALSCGYFKIKKNALLHEDFSPAFSLSNMLKDVRFVDQAAKEKKLNLPVSQSVRLLMESALAEGLGEEDLSSISKILRPATLSN